VSSGSTVYGTNVAPISFPGIVSGIDYNEIIDKLTQLSLAPTTQLNAQIATLNNANTELIKISNLVSSVQNALANLSNPDLFQTYQATSSDTSALSATGVPGVTATPGLYTIESVKAATNTSILSSTSAGHSITDLITSGTYSGQASNTVPLAYSYAKVVPSNGNSGSGSVTVDGVQISYNVDSQSLTQILQNITTQVDAHADAGFLATLVNGVAEFESNDGQQISLGSNLDQGNLLNVLQLSNAQLLTTVGGGGFIQGTSNVGGINPDADFNSGDGAGFVTPVTAGTFTINGQKISVAADENLSDVLNAINSSTAGVTAVFNAVSGQIQLTNSNSGPQSIVLGATGDTSNFLKAAGLTAASGAKTTVGQQSAITVQNPDGSSSTYYNNSNTVTNAVPGMTLNITGNTTSPFTVDVTQNTTLLVSTVQAFISTYNAAVHEINTATAAPIVLAIQPGTNSTAQSVPGGVLWGDASVESIIPELENIVGGFLGNNPTYNSLAQAGILLVSSFSTVSATSIEQQGTGSSPVQQSQVDGTDGSLAPLNVNAFLQAYASNPNAVQNLLVGAKSLTTQLGTYLTSITGAPTLLNAGPVGTPPAVALIQNDENGNTDTITNLQQQISQITDEANQQANALRSGFVASETAIAGLQAEQQELASVFGFSTTSSASGSGTGG
jgi:flagellar hook-associated protein 2